MLFGLRFLMLADFEGMEKFDAYNRWIFHNTRDFVGKRVLDLGSGIGTITRFFLDRELVVGTDIDRENVLAMKKRFGGKKNFSALLFDIEKGDYSKMKGFGFDTVFSSNSLEHTKDDEAVLRKAWSILPKNGKIVLFVPAHGWLFGSMDSGAKHYRRYSKRILRERLEKAGFEVKRMSYMNFPGIFYWYFFGKILKKPVKEGVEIAVNNGAINFLVKAYSRIERITGTPLGLSIVCVGEKK